MRRTAAIPVLLALLAAPVLCAAGEEGGGAYLGVHGQKMTALLADALGLEEAAGVLLSSVKEESPAGKAGLRRGDILLEWNGETIRSPRGLIRLVRKAEPGEKIEIAYLRRGDRREAKVTLGEREAGKETEKARRRRSGRRGERTSPLSGRLGVKVRDLVADLAPYFDLPAGSGALVTELAPGGPAEKAGLLVGDVIVEMDGTAIRSAGDLTETLAGRRPGEEVELVLVRKGEKETVAVELGAARSPFARFRDFPFPERDWKRFRGLDERFGRELDRLKKEMERLREKIDEMGDE